MALPGLSFEIVKSSGPILGLRADRTAMLALTERGPEEVPTLVHSHDEFIARFGVAMDGMLGPLAAEAYFKNGGTDLLVARFLPRKLHAADPTAGVASAASAMLGVVGATDASVSVTVSAKDSGSFANRITVEALPSLRKRIKGSVSQTVSGGDAILLQGLLSPVFASGDEVELPVRVIGTNSGLVRIERWGRIRAITNAFTGSGGTQRIQITTGMLDGMTGLALLEVYETTFSLRIREPARADILVGGLDLRDTERVNNTLEPWRLELTLTGDVETPELPQPDRIVRLSGGGDGLNEPDDPVQLARLLAGLRASFLRAAVAVENSDEADIVIAPDLWSRVFRTKGVVRLAFEASTAVELSDELVLAAERTRDRVVLLDPPLNGAPELRPFGVEELTNWRTEREMRLVTARDFAAVYTPWVRVVAGPVFRGDDTMPMPPSAFVAGQMALNARERGPWIATGNVALEGVVGLEQTLSLADEEQLQDRGMNPLRMVLPRGATIQGVRSLAYPDRKPWRFLSTRSLFNFLRRALAPIGRSYVFEPNNSATWITLRRDIERLLRNMLANRAFASSRPENAFFVKIDDQLNPEASRVNGILTARIGVAPAVPLEFLVVRLLVGRGVVDVTEEPILR